jgi:hypothetical protein
MFPLVSIIQCIIIFNVTIDLHLLAQPTSPRHNGLYHGQSIDHDYGQFNVKIQLLFEVLQYQV